MNDSSVLGKNWILKNYNEETVNFLKDNFNLSEIVSKLIAIRKIKLEEVNLFLKPKIKNSLPNPFVLKDMSKTVDRTIKAILNSEKIGLFGDYDVDGASSTALIGKVVAIPSLQLTWLRMMIAFFCLLPFVIISGRY